MENIYEFFFTLFSPLCHQITERSFQSFDGHQFFVCARDTGTYLGFLFSFTLYFYNKDKFKAPISFILVLFFLHLLLFGLDGVTSYAGLRETTNFIRYFTGFYLGFFLGVILQYVKIFITKPENIAILDIKKSLLITFFLEIYCTFLFFITLFLIKYLLYLLAFAIIFYVYQIVNVILSLFFFNYEKKHYYYLALAIIFIVFFSSMLLAGTFKINMVEKLYHK
mgnify:CR=1 FL=1